MDARVGLVTDGHAVGLFQFKGAAHARARVHGFRSFVNDFRQANRLPALAYRDRASGGRFKRFLWHYSTPRAGNQWQEKQFRANGAEQIVDKPSVCQRGLPGRLSTHRSALTLARCSVPAHYASLRVLATSALRASDGQRPGRECIFLRKCKHLLPKNTRNDVHAVISD